MLTVSIPSWRSDIVGEACLVEEIVRVYGYDNIPPVSLVPDKILPEVAIDQHQSRQSHARRTLAKHGLVESVTYSFLSEEDSSLFGGTTPSKAVKLLNKDPEKYRPTPADKLFKPIWKTPPPIKVDLGKISSDQWRAAVIKNAQKANPAYTEEEIITKFGFDRVVNLGSGWFGRDK